MPPKFVPRQRKHKVLARQKAAKLADTSSTSTDANATQIIPLSKDEKEAKRHRLREELRAQQPKISSKKQKRLDKYIENKLKKDENLDLVRKLEKEKAKWDPKGLLSSKNLKKRGFDEFVNGQIGRVPDHEVVEVSENTKKGRQEEDRDTDDAASEDSFEEENREAFDNRDILETDETWAAKRAPPVQGTGLAQPLELGADGLPIIPMRAGKKKRKEPEVHFTITRPAQVAATDLPWEGFESEPEEYPSNSPGNMSDADSVDKDDLDGLSEDEDSQIYSTETESNPDTDTSATSEEHLRIKPRTSAFKSWATQQLNQAVGHTPLYAPDGEGTLPVSKASDHTLSAKPAQQEPVKLINGLPEVKTPTVNRKISSVQVQRTEGIQQGRSLLPIIQREQEIMEAIHANPVVVIKGDTGSGKTTQVPQFLYEAGYGDPDSSTSGMIGITQPRRVAAVSMAKRVGEELGEHGAKVAHQIRFDSTVSANTAVKFMTDGILLRELSQDLLLRKYSAIVIDEAHERSVNTDILIGMLSKIVPARMKKDKFNPDPKPLKLIIMSATLNIDDFLHEKLFSHDLRPPIVEAEGRQHRVTTHFALRSRADYLEEVVEKLKRAHRKLPKGAILCFLTGQDEIRQVQNRLRKELAGSDKQASTSLQPSKMHITASETPLEIEDVEFGFSYARGGNGLDDLEEDGDDEIKILTHSDEEAEDKEFEISDDEEDENGKDRDHALLTDTPTSSHHKKDPYDTVHVLPLYSQLPTKDQLRVFEPAPDRSRMIVLATNVAETSLTIPGIRYVFDCGRSKERKYNLESGVQSFEIDWISKASAQQRAGRAGRTGPGHCWRLYTSAVYERFFPDHAEPEVLRTPAESVVLQIKGFAYPKPVVEFPFPSPPTSQTLDKAEKLLKNLGALTVPGGNMTELGKQLSIYPLSPRLGKILASAVKERDNVILKQVIRLAAGLAVGDIYINNNAMMSSSDNEAESGVDEDKDRQKQQYGRAQAALSKHDKTSDVMKLLTAVSTYIDSVEKDEFCKSHYLKPKAMREISQLTQQLWSIVSSNHPDVLAQKQQTTSSSKSKSKFSSITTKLINTTAASGYIDQIAIRWDCHPTPPTLTQTPRRAIDTPYIPLVPLHISSPRSKGVAADLTSKAIFIHPSSILSRTPPKSLPQYIVYTHLQQSQPATITSSSSSSSASQTGTKTRMFPLCPIDTASLSKLAQGSGLIRYGKLVSGMKIEDVAGGKGRERICWVSVELKDNNSSGGGATGGFGWPLSPVKVRQVVDVKCENGWRVVEVLS